jgi:hypothetical protein
MIFISKKNNKLRVKVDIQEIEEKRGEGTNVF